LSSNFSTIPIFLVVFTYPNNHFLKTIIALFVFFNYNLNIHAITLSVSNPFSINSILYLQGFGEVDFYAGILVKPLVLFAINRRRSPLDSFSLIAFEKL